MRMPVSRPTPFSHDALHKRALGDFQFELWQDSEAPAAPVSEETVERSSPKRRKSDADGLYTLVHRPKDSKAMPTCSEDDSENDSSSDELGFMLVHRPKAPSTPPAATEWSPSFPSSPDLVHVTPTEIKTETHSASSANVSRCETNLEEDWSFI